MSRERPNLSLVVDEVLADASAATRRRDAEANAIKIAEAQPRTEVARGLRALAADLRASRDDVTYADLGRSA